MGVMDAARSQAAPPGDRALWSGDENADALAHYVLQEDPPGEAVAAAPALPTGAFVLPRHGAGERLLRFAYGLGVPPAVLRSPFSRPQRLRLLATVANPLPGSKAAGTALRAGFFLVHGVKLPIAGLDFAAGTALSLPACRMIHSFAWLDDLEAAGAREQVAPVAEQILGAWLSANSQPPKKPEKRGAWSIANSADRLLAWLIHAPLVLSSANKALRAQMLGAIADTARWLDRHGPRAGNGLAQAAAWAALIAAGLLLPGGRPRRLYGEAGLIAALGAQVGDDGGLLSRSPLDQIAVVALLVRLSACYRATRREVPSSVQAILTLLLPPLLALTHSDGSLSSWQGGWAIAADRLALLESASGIRARPLRDVRQWGYQRVAAARSVLLLDAAPPPLGHHARAGCASTLAIEFSHAGQRVFVNCGGSAAVGGAMPQRLEAGLRATAAHSTLVLDDTNSTAVLADGRLGSGVSEVKIDRRLLAPDAAKKPGLRAPPGAMRLEASHDGYAARLGLIHRRILILRDDGTHLRGEDVLEPVRRKARRAKVGFALRFHLGPGIEAALTPGGQNVDLALPDGSIWQFCATGGDLSVEDSIWADEEGRPVAIRQLVVLGTIARKGGALAWLLQKME